MMHNDYIDNYRTLIITEQCDRDYFKVIVLAELTGNTITLSSPVFRLFDLNRILTGDS